MRPWSADGGADAEGAAKCWCLREEGVVLLALAMHAGLYWRAMSADLSVSLRSRCLSYVARRGGEGLSPLRTGTGALPLSAVLVGLFYQERVLALILND